jgi:hypothetical protein
MIAVLDRHGAKNTVRPPTEVPRWTVALVPLAIVARDPLWTVARDRPPTEVPRWTVARDRLAIVARVPRETAAVSIETVALALPAVDRIVAPDSMAVRVLRPASRRRSWRKSPPLA